MSSLSNLPYGSILDYWSEKLSDNPYRTKFLLTKVIEIFTFQSHSRSNRKEFMFRFTDFQEPINNFIPENPLLSIVIPAYIKTEKDKNDLTKLLESINKQTNLPYKVIVIDDYSPTNYLYPNNIISIKLPKNLGPAVARNLGKKIALNEKSDIIAFTDVDCILSDNWVETIISKFIKQKQYHILSGNTISFDKNWFGTYHNINGTLNGRKFKNCEKLLYGTTANLAITKEVAMSVDFSKNFPIAAGEDIEFCFKANKNGFAIKHINTMIVYHNFGYNNNFWNNLKQFRKQFKKYGQGEQILLKLIPEYYSYFDKTEEIPVM